MHRRWISARSTFLSASATHRSEWLHNAQDGLESVFRALSQLTLTCTARLLGDHNKRQQKQDETPDDEMLARNQSLGCLQTSVASCCFRSNQPETQLLPCLGPLRGLHPSLGTKEGTVMYKKTGRLKITAIFTSAERRESQANLWSPNESKRENETAPDKKYSVAYT